MEQHKMTVDELPKHCCSLLNSGPVHMLTADELPKYISSILIRAEKK